MKRKPTDKELESLARRLFRGAVSAEGGDESQDAAVVRAVLGTELHDAQR